MSGRRGKHIAPKKTRRGKRQGRTREETRREDRHPARTHEKHRLETHEKHRLERYSDWDLWQACKPTVDFKEEHGTVVIEVDCGDVGAIKFERTSYDNKVAFFKRTGGGWQQMELGGITQLVILAHTIVEAFVALNREGIPPPAPAGPFLTESFRLRSMQTFHRGRPFNKPTVDFKEEDRAVVIEIDCGDDVGGVKVERSSDNAVAFLERTGGTGNRPCCVRRNLSSWLTRS